MKKYSASSSAFTLLEMIIAITVFTIFIGFAISTYLTFHRADQEALTMRSVMLETQAAMDNLAQAAKENAIDYDYYGSESSLLNLSTLALVDSSGIAYIYEWNNEEEILTLSITDLDGNSSEPVLLHSESTRIKYVSFRIFPNASPYEIAAEEENQFQPNVRIQITFAMPGRINEEVAVDLQTSVTSRFYK